MRFLSIVAVTLCLAASAWSQITAVTPNRGSLGTSLTITGSGFGDRKPKVVLTQALPAPGKKARKFTLKVTSFSATQVVATASTGVLGIFNVTVTPSGRGATALTRNNAFDFVIPSVGVASPTSGNPNAVITVTGQHFGSKKGFLILGGQRTSVTAWSDTSISFKVPTKLANGAYTIEVKNKLGTGSRVNAFTVTGSQVGISKTDILTARIGSFNFSAKKPFLNGVFGTTLKLVNIQSFKRIGLKGANQTFGITGVMDLSKPFPQTLTKGNSDILIVFSNTTAASFGVTRTRVYSTTRSGTNYTINLIAFSGNRLAGNITGTLKDEDSGEVIQLTNCNFTCTLVVGP